jgi:uncharacterized Zn-finger protein
VDSREFNFAVSLEPLIGSNSISLNRSNSHAEFLFHEALHRVPLDQDPKLKLKCQICKRLFSKQSLREHFRQHTNERIFQCSAPGCPMSFTRKANLKNHLANVHRDGAESATNVCRVCGKSFHSK